MSLEDEGDKINHRIAMAIAGPNVVNRIVHGHTAAAMHEAGGDSKVSGEARCVMDADILVSDVAKNEIELAFVSYWTY